MSIRGKGGGRKKAAKKTAKRAAKKAARKKAVRKAVRKSVHVHYRSSSARPQTAGAAVLDPPVRARRTATTGPNIPDEVWAAKALAVEQFFRPADPAMSQSFRAIDPDPRANVVGVGIGHPRDWARRGGRPAIRFYVLARMPDAAIEPRHRLPARIGGLPTEVVEAGPFIAHRAATIDPKQRLRPARPGASISFVHTGAQAGRRTAGTLGAVIRADGRRGILSNNHVLADENELALGSPILQPGTLDGGDPARDAIAQLTRFVPLTARGANLIDAAYALALDDGLLDPAVLPPIGRLASADPLPAAKSARVAKFGRTTQYTEGQIIEISADVYMRYDLGRLHFREQVFVAGTGGPFSAPGDSGSLVVDVETRRPVALLIGGEPRQSIASPIARVLTALGVDLEI